MIDYESIYATIADPDSRILNDSFRRICQRLLTKINSNRRSMQFTPYELDRVIIFVNELYYSALLNDGRLRRNGEPIFETHLIGTLENMIDDQNLTGLTSLLSGLKHDDVEDLGLTMEKLFRISTYRQHLTMLNDSYLVKLQQNVYRIVSGITKVQRETRKQTKEETFRRLLEYLRDYGIRVGYVKIADRTHNMQTLEGHGQENIDKQRDIATETEELYVPLARLFRIIHSEVRLIRSCFRFLNPGFLEDFDRMVREKEAEFLSPIRHRIEEQFGSDGCYVPDSIQAVTIVKRDLDYLLGKYNVTIPYQDLRLSDLPIDELDPMFEIVVLVNHPNMISPLIGRVIEKFSEGKLNLNAVELDFNQGTQVRIYNRKYNGRLSFRINDCVSEVRSRRGLLANIDDKMPKGLREGIATILSLSSDDKSDIFTLARREFLQPQIQVYTPRNMMIELPLGATTLDFSGKIHEDVLKGAQKALICDDIWGKNPRDFSLFDELPDGVMVFVESCLSSGKGRQPDPTAIKVDPGWLLFCQSTARTILSRYLRGSDELSWQKGEQFLSKICHLCDEIPSRLISMIRRHSRQFQGVTDHGITISIGRGDINLVRVVSELPRFNKTDLWMLRVTLPNQPMSLSTFTQKLGPSINIERTEMDQTAPGAIGTIVLAVKFDQQKMSTFEFLRRLLKVHYDGYSMSLSSSVRAETTLSGD